jgi:hypothetical protein
MSRDLVYLSSDDPRSNETTRVLVESGDASNASSRRPTRDHRAARVSQNSGGVIGGPS